MITDGNLKYVHIQVEIKKKASQKNRGLIDVLTINWTNIIITF